MSRLQIENNAFGELTQHWHLTQTIRTRDGCSGKKRVPAPPLNPHALAKPLLERLQNCAKGVENVNSGNVTPHGLNKEQWLEKLAAIDASLKAQGVPTKLTLIGSAAGIFAGQPSRTSIDLDVWKPRSKYQLGALRQAVESAGMLFDPESVLETTTPYLQMMEPGLSQLGRFAETEPLERFSTLELERQPIANLVAAKLVRAEPKDLEDIAFLMATFRPEKSDVEKAVQSMPRDAREKASENLVYLRVMSSP